MCRLLISLAMVLLVSGCSLFTPVIIKDTLAHPVMYKRCPDTLPLTTGVTGADGLKLSYEWALIYHNCKDINNTKADMVEKIKKELE